MFVRATEPLPEAVSAPSPVRATDDSSLLRFQISIEPGSGLSQAALRLSFRNVSSERIRVLRRPELGRQNRRFTDVWLEIVRASDGSEPETVCRRGCDGLRIGGPPRLDDYIVLEPGDEISTTEQLDCDYALPDEGPWRVVAHYRDESEGPPRQERSATIAWFNGILDSNTLEISVPPYDQVLRAYEDDERQRREEGERVLQELRE